MFVFVFKTALNCDKAEQYFGKKKEIEETEEGPEWIKELNKFDSSLDGN